MFTGLIEALGQLHPMGSTQVQIQANPSHAQAILTNLAIGDSVAVDGVCLTVERILPDGFIAAVSPETLQRTTLGNRLAGGNGTGQASWVNLESSLRVGSKLGGHFVTGHIDGMGWLESAVPTATSWEMRFNATDAISRYIIPKGSIAVNGISLTVAACSDRGDWFTVAVIPHTYEQTNLHLLRPGSPVNLEGDILGKYVEKFLRSGLQPGLTAAPLTMDTGIITPEFLAEHGYG